MSGLEIGLLLAGTSASVGGKIAAGNAQADASRKDADLKNQQADELLARERINEGIIEEKSLRQQQQYGAQFAAQGVEGAGIGGQLLMQKYANEQISNNRRDAEFQAAMTRAGAKAETQLAGEQEASGYLGGAGTLLTGGIAVANTFKGPSTQTVGLPKMGPTGEATSINGVDFGSNIGPEMYA